MLVLYRLGGLIYPFMRRFFPNAAWALWWHFHSLEDLRGPEPHYTPVSLDELEARLRGVTKPEGR